MDLVKVGDVYIRAELEEYILKNESMFIELDGEPGFLSCVPNQKLRVVSVYNNVDSSDIALDIDKFRKTKIETKIISHAFRQQVIIVEKIK